VDLKKEDPPHKHGAQQDPNVPTGER